MRRKDIIIVIGTAIITIPACLFISGWCVVVIIASWLFGFFCGTLDENGRIETDKRK